MTVRTADLRLQDMIDEINHIRQYMNDAKQPGFGGDTIHLRASERCLTILSEAAIRVPDELATLHPEIPWSEIRGLADILISDPHRYDANDVWQIASRIVTYRPALVELFRASLVSPP